MPEINIKTDITSLYGGICSRKPSLKGGEGGR